MKNCFYTMIVLIFTLSLSNAQEFVPNYDEAHVPPYILPDPLILASGEKVADAATWQQKRRAEIFKLFEEQMYGRAPGKPDKMAFKKISVDKKALGGKAICKQVSVYFSGKSAGAKMDILIYLPKRTPKPVPLFIGLNFDGNHTICADEKIAVTQQWVANNPGYGIIDNRASEASRGASAAFWPVERILERGYGLATIYYGDMDPDFDDGFQNGFLEKRWEESIPGSPTGSAKISKNITMAKSCCPWISTCSSH